ncbi:hypothetical protein [Hymenobacter actinosclerus]|uniref:Uncharacterized protein n=1 Tax=Hymenobacter actinosclerus TaxID=82805 RepID=A0A1I0BTP3_9BACT|nr:hypothetical protein [Hymenobacter actinosclerus]SET10404.1 hypothetical protein SAMN04487998_1192 [Hymenobacter actinosclerus]
MQYLQQVATVKVRGQSELQGIVLASGAKWELLRSIPVDYVVDGLVFVNQKYLLKKTRGEDEEFAEKILRLKMVSFENRQQFDLDSTPNLFTQLQQQEKLVQLTLHDDSVNFIGQIVQVNRQSFRCRLLGVKAEWLQEVNIKYAEVRTIGLATDYVLSLQLVIDSEDSLT